MAGIRISVIFQTFLKTGILCELIFLVSVDGLPNELCEFLSLVKGHGQS